MEHTITVLILPAKPASLLAQSARVDFQPLAQHVTQPIFAISAQPPLDPAFAWLPIMTQECYSVSHALVNV